MRMGSVCSGIGGLELGLEWAGVGETIWQVEIDAKCRAVLAHHWSRAERFNDIKEVGRANLSPVDLICGGFPCQDISPAGKRAGLDGARSGLWFEFHRIVSEVRPYWVVVENVGGNAVAYVDTVCGGLAELGYGSLPIPLQGCDVGAPHERSRVFILAADLDENRKPPLTKHAKKAASQAVADVDQVGIYEQPRRRERADRAGSSESANDGQATAADLDEARPARARHSEAQGWRGERPPADHWRSPEPNVVRSLYGFSVWLDRCGVADANAFKTFSDEDMRTLRDFLLSQETKEREAGGPPRVSSASVLLTYMRKLEAYRKTGHVLLASQAPSQIGVRSVLGDHVVDGAPRGPTRGKQRTPKPTNTLQEVSRLLARRGEKAWLEFRRQNADSGLGWQDGIGIARIATNAGDRARVGALGNAVIPQCGEVIGHVIRQLSGEQ